MRGDIYSRLLTTMARERNKHDWWEELEWEVGIHRLIQTAHFRTSFQQLDPG